MDKQNPQQETENRNEFILKAAQKRLGMYGYEKTTMQEIADDISMSKASLYYYFPDKESLFTAVISNEQKEYFATLKSRLASLVNADEMVLELVEMRHELFRKFLNLSKFRLSEQYKGNPVFKSLYRDLREKEIDILIEIFNLGRESGLFLFDDTKQIAELFSDLLQGLRIMEIKMIRNYELDQDESGHLLETLRIATRIFINGLKYNKLKNKAF